ncbi:PepSY domain-containing protein [Pseudobacteriovorax antillogorgiicola]|uniref:PepSY-associated TM region n=1 Tax=Pseudobacteriovorax antillogorgiicola TaxID=1513793 RepID=A0A1Y6BBN3_9BACT|nr:PepSY domain-containing protein [Pseudobacteriovorax antillogorgiicola]TCS58766.1 PepSY-associated transmembrane protein [Pseudobacteriovorax antillogorgiicola]SME94962.1 PepSY-associated TM region [Pseudobacteriovorax antillogorgiicola]
MSPRIRMSRWARRWHYKVAITATLPILTIIISGLLLQIKKEWSWIQPPTQRAQAYVLDISFEDVLSQARSQAEHGRIESWSDVSRLDVRPDRGIIKVRLKDGWELQLDAASGLLLQEAYRRSDIIEAIHDGSFFHDHARLWIFLPAALLLLFLSISGVMMFLVQEYNRRASKQVRKQRLAA